MVHHHGLARFGADRIMITGSPEQDAVLCAALSVGLSIDLNALLESHYGDRTDGDAILAREYLGNLQRALDALLRPATNNEDQEIL